jgi:NADP-dependent 3-hydroxy acid dehydrogenase YdfG
MVRLAGKFALITGGSSGIGLATAKAFVANGARVAITGRDQKTLDAAKEAIDGDHLAFKCDAANLTEIDTLYAAIKERFGALDIIFANAGVADSSPMERSNRTELRSVIQCQCQGCVLHCAERVTTPQTRRLNNSQRFNCTPYGPSRSFSLFGEQGSRPHVCA